MAIQDEYVRITLRLPQELHERLTSASLNTFRSMNAEIVHRLEYTFRTEDALQEMAEYDTEVVPDTPPEQQMLSNLTTVRATLCQALEALNEVERIHDQQTGLASHTLDEETGGLIKSYEKSARQLKR